MYLIRRGIQIFVISILGFMLLGSPAIAQMKILSVPGCPFFVVVNFSRGLVESAYFRSPAGIQKLLPIEGSLLISQKYSKFDMDKDLTKDILWVLTFGEPTNRQRGLQMWIGYSSRQKTIWVDICPVASTLWDYLPIKLNLPEGVLPYVLPQLPKYDDLPPFGGPKTLTFVCTIKLTNNGPKFVPQPEVYKQLLKIAELVASSERYPKRKESYFYLINDYKNLSSGTPPTLDALKSIQWKRILTLRWNN
ncbi:hypothetical protein [Thermovirga sp.]|uniref:hypothetical protein n=1 Tax=Thermovirga sp. TaxID=2699834 RepID=UPI0025F00BE3|nr:hypothetical protein [Thermovirga sp.]MBO8153458.1 hypothetical protein [Thermovirga sp.]